MISDKDFEVKIYPRQSGQLSSFSSLSNELISTKVTKNYKSDYNRNLDPLSFGTLFKDPLDDDVKSALINMYKSDHLIRTIFNLNSWTTINYPHKYHVYPLIADQDENNTDEDVARKISTETGLNVADQKRLLKYVETVIEVSNFEQWLQSYWIDAMVGGRSAFFVETMTNTKKDFIKDVDIYQDTPILFKPLFWGHLGQTLVNRDTFRIKEVEYKDSTLYYNESKQEGRKDYIDIDNLIYITCDDGDHLGSSFGYGNSRLVPLIHLSAARRQATDRDIPELLTSFWNQTGILETNDTSDENIKYLLDNIFKSGSIAVVKNQNAKFTPVALKHDGWFIIQFLGLSRTEMLRMLRTPDFLLNYDADSRSVTESAISIWSDFVIGPDRDQIFRQVYPQFIHKLVRLFLKNNGLDENIANGIRINPVFKRISIEDLLSKANSLELLIRRDIVTKRESRNILNLPEKKMEDKEEDMKLSPLQWASLSEQEKLLLMQTAAKKSLMNSTPAEASPKTAASLAIGNGNGEADMTGKMQQGHAEGTAEKFTDAQKESGIKTPKTRSNARPLTSRGAGKGRKV